MLVTLPFVMLLLDFWPLNRVEKARRKRSFAMERRAIFFEKLPFLFLAIGSCIITLRALDDSTGRMEFGLGTRLATAVVSYPLYLGKLFWPTNLAVFYPQPGHWPVWLILLGLLIILGLSLGVIFFRRYEPSLFVGWFWFLVALVPVSGLLPVDGYAIADRHTYFPSIGIAVALVWGLGWLATRWAVVKVVAPWGAVVIIGIFAWLTNHQIAVWQNGGTLFEHALAVTKNNALAANKLGTFCMSAAKCAEAEKYCREAVRIQPDYVDAWNNLGLALSCQQKIEEAMGAFSEAMRLRPQFAAPYNNYGRALAAKGKENEAFEFFKKAVAYDPSLSDAHYNLAQLLMRQQEWEEARNELALACELFPGKYNPEYHFSYGNALVRVGQMAEAIFSFREAIHLQPDFAPAHNNLGKALFTIGRKEEAMREYAEAVRLNPRDADAHVNLGDAIAEQGKWDEAIIHYESALEIDPEFAPVRVSRALAYIKKGWAADAAVEMQEVLKNNPNFAEAHYALGMAFKATLDLDGAKREFTEALRLKPDYEDAKQGLADLQKMSR